MIDRFLNIRHSLRDLTDEEFETSVSQLAYELEPLSFYSVYSASELLTDWKKLTKWDAHTKSIASTQRIGMKLCEHFFPNFYDIKDRKGNSFKSLWTATNLEKVLRWNRKSHSTPYLSEIKRGIYFNFGLSKSTMYRPQMAKMVVRNLGAKKVLDPCAGWGGRMLGSVAAGSEYIGFEPNSETYTGLVRLAEFLDISDKVTLIKDSALNLNNHAIGEVDLILTSPPYFDLEVYTHEDTQSIAGCESYAGWVDKFLTPVIQLSLEHLNASGWSCWNVHNIGKMKMIEDVAKIHINHTTQTSFAVTSSKRQMNQLATVKNGKNNDVTICYSKESVA